MPNYQNPGDPWFLRVCNTPELSDTHRAALDFGWPWPIIRHGAEFPMRVLLVVDYSPASDRAVRECAERDWPGDTVVRVLGIAEKIPPAAVELWYNAAGSLDAVYEARRERAEELAGAAVSILHDKGIKADAAVRVGRRRKIIRAEASAWPADVTMGATQTAAWGPAIGRLLHLLKLR